MTTTPRTPADLWAVRTTAAQRRRRHLADRSLRAPGAPEPPALTAPPSLPAVRAGPSASHRRLMAAFTLHPARMIHCAAFIESTGYFGHYFTFLALRNRADKQDARIPAPRVPGRTFSGEIRDLWHLPRSSGRGLTGQMFVGSEVLLDVSFDVACTRVAALAHDGWLGGASGAAYREWGTGLARVGPLDSVPGVSRLVEVRFRDLVTHGESAVLALRWEAACPGGGLFPVLDADITLTPAGESATALKPGRVVPAAARQGGRHAGPRGLAPGGGRHYPGFRGAGRGCRGESGGRGRMGARKRGKRSRGGVHGRSGCRSSPEPT